MRTQTGEFYMTEHTLDETWDVLEETVGFKPPSEQFSDHLTYWYRRGVLTYDEARFMYLCAIGLDTTDNYEPPAPLPAERGKESEHGS